MLVFCTVVKKHCDLAFHLIFHRFSPFNCGVYQATKRHLNNSWTVENDEKIRWKAKSLIWFWSSYVGFLYSTEEALYRKPTLLNQKQISDLAFHLIFRRFPPFNCCVNVVWITPNICNRVFVLINSVLFNLLCVWICHLIGQLTLDR